MKAVKRAESLAARLAALMGTKKVVPKVASMAAQSGGYWAAVLAVQMAEMSDTSKVARTAAGLVASSVALLVCSKAGQ